MWAKNDDYVSWVEVQTSDLEVSDQEDVDTQTENDALLSRPPSNPTQRRGWCHCCVPICHCCVYVVFPILILLINMTVGGFSFLSRWHGHMLKEKCDVPLEAFLLFSGVHASVNVGLLTLYIILRHLESWSLSQSLIAGSSSVSSAVVTKTQAKLIAAVSKPLQDAVQQTSKFQVISGHEGQTENPVADPIPPFFSSTNSRCIPLLEAGLIMNALMQVGLGVIGETWFGALGLLPPSDIVGLCKNTAPSMYSYCKFIGLAEDWIAIYILLLLFRLICGCNYKR